MFRRTRLALRAEHVFSILIVMALFFFELFNYSTTDFALHDLLGDLKFLGLRWSTILALAFCGIDFAGIARLFTTNDEGEPTETWYLLGAWLLAASMNAMLTWWGVSVALLQHVPAGASVLGAETVRKVVPVFVAILVWLVRVLIMGTLSVAGQRLLGAWTWETATSATPRRVTRRRPATVAAAAPEPAPRAVAARAARVPTAATRPRPTTPTGTPPRARVVAEPVYEPIPATAAPDTGPTGQPRTARFV